MDMQRRSLLKGIGGTGLLAAALATGLLRPTLARAEDWNKGAFEAKELAAALAAIGAGAAAENKELQIKAPEIAENGAVVSVTVISNIANTVSIAVLANKNPWPLSALFEFANGALPEVSLNMKLGQTTQVKAVAKAADGKFYTVQREVKVTTGGCGD